MDYSAKLTLPYILPNQAQKHVTMNESLRRLDALVQISVISMTETEPPETPEEGDRYIVAAGGTGAWARADGHVAARQDGAWEIYEPQTGWLVWDEAQTALAIFDGADWTALGPSSELDMLGINATADTYNRLSVRSDASLFSHEGAGHQVKINKASENDTASLLFQSNWQGRAEIGLTGSNDLEMKLSSNGQSFASAFFANSVSGFVGIGTSSPSVRLDVNGALRLDCVSRDGLPDAETAGAGTLIFMRSDTQHLSLVYSDGQEWRFASSGVSISR